ncbi:MAG TPA: protein-L-isoaspartate(D-aspartate) O-methyltransferase [Pyrinomonadaceae bacterium]|nr:protein-L-isoaspartate(D-aspartate) O-methyltransferase [Pyrinomonadaceae bacterium]
MKDEYEISRKKMIDHLRGHYKIRDERVLSAMMQIRRDFFVPTALKAQAYKDNALPISSKQTISQPYIVAKMSELLELNLQSKVLEIGAGSGYQTAILAALAGQVFAIERIPILANEAQEKINQFGFQNVKLACADGTNGWQTFAPFDAILVAAGSPHLPQPLLNQLKIGGKLVIPIGKNQQTQNLFRVTRNREGFQTEDFGACAFVPLIGEHGWK